MDKIKRIFVFNFLLFFPFFVFGQNIRNEKALYQNFKLSEVQLPFIANTGQTHEDVKFYAYTFSGTVFITKKGSIVYSLPEMKKEGNTTGTALAEEIIGLQNVQIFGRQKTSAQINSFRGKDISKWETDIPAYEVIDFGEVYDGIELKIKAGSNNVEKLFFIHPGSDPGLIRVKLNGSKGIRTNKNGMLEVETEPGSVYFTKPVAYQKEGSEKKYVDIKYKISGDEYGFEVGDYEQRKQLIIDPLLASTYVGGSEGEFCKAIALDKDENVYIVGNTGSVNFPVTAGVYCSSYGGGDGDVFLCKLSSDLTRLIASTFFGGDRDESGNFIVLDDENNVYITGHTYSENFPVTLGSFDITYNGGDADVFIAKFDSDLKKLLISTFIGGSGRESDWRGPVIKLDNEKNVYLAGGTSSNDFPTTSDSYDPEFNGGSDIFITKFDADLTKIKASTYLGGSGMELFGNSLEISPAGDKIYVNGISMGPGYPRVEGSYTRSIEGGGGSFVSMLDKDLKTLTASSVVDGGWHYCMALDKDGSVFVGGHGGSDYPTTPDAFLETRKNYLDGAYISKYDADLTRLLSSTYIGGSVSGESSGHKIPLSLAVDNNGEIIACGWTRAVDHPVTPGAHDETHNGISDMFVLKFDNNLKQLSASTFIGGSDKERWSYLALGKSGDIYVSSYSLSKDFPTTDGAFSEKQNGGATDAFVVKFSNDLSSETIIKAHDAAKKDEIAGLNKALSDKPSSIEEKDKYNRTPLHWTGRYGSLKTMQYLLEKGADINSKDESGNTPLHLATIYNHREAAEMLLSAGTDINVRNKDGDTPLHLAAKFCSNEILELLITKKTDIDITNNDGNSPLHMAVKYVYKEIVEMLLSANADVNFKNNEGNTVLFSAIQSRNKKEILETLLNNKADINAKDKEGRIPLQYAVSNYIRKQDVQFLLERGSDINSKDNSGKTALHYALEKGQFYNDIIREMIEKGANINIKDNTGKTPLDLAKEKNNTEIIKLMLDKK